MHPDAPPRECLPTLRRGRTRNKCFGSIISRPPSKQQNTRSVWKPCVATGEGGRRALARLSRATFQKLTARVHKLSNPETLFPTAHPPLLTPSRQTLSSLRAMLRKGARRPLLRTTGNVQAHHNLPLEKGTHRSGGAAATVRFPPQSLPERRARRERKNTPPPPLPRSLLHALPLSLPPQLPVTGRASASSSAGSRNRAPSWTAH